MNLLQQSWRVGREVLGLGLTVPQDNRVHLDAAMAWLCRAQDVTKKNNIRDDGVAQTYFVKTGRWAASYPETTGYIIPTFYRYWRLTGNEEFRRRAVRMADWECAVQHSSGGVLAGALGDSDRPTIFNTGQVLFGWITAYEVERNETYKDAATRAAAWLCDNQDADGCWRRFSSPFTRANISLYNTRSAWGLLRVHEITGIERFRDFAIKNIEWALTQQQDNGWFPHNCLNDSTQPYLHTIAYAMRGLLESGAYLKQERYLTAARKIADALLRAMPESGALAGRFDGRWKPTVTWICLTGVAQFGINLGRLYQTTGESRYREALRRSNRFLRSTQKLDGDINERGGIKGSHPINGGYHPWQYPNWAAKFFADSSMLEDAIG